MTTAPSANVSGSAAIFAKRQSDRGLTLPGGADVPNVVRSSDVFGETEGVVIPAKSKSMTPGTTRIWMSIMNADEASHEDCRVLNL